MNDGDTAPTAPPSVVLELYTGAGLLQEAGAWLDVARERLVQPLVAELAAKRQPAAGRAPTEWGAPGGLHTGITAEDDHGAVAVFTFDERAWRKALGTLASGRLRSLAYEVTPLDDTGFPEADSASLRFDLNSNDPADIAPTVTASVSRPFYRSLDEIQETWVEVAKEGARRLQAKAGYLTVGHVALGWSPAREQAYQASATRLPGSHWGNLLNATHVERLGGFARVSSDAPCQVVEELPGGGAYLQATTTLGEFPDDVRKRLERFLQPILASIDPVPMPTEGDRAVLVFKYEELEEGQPLGPAMVSTADGNVEELGWMTLSRARELATELGYEFAED